MTSGQTPEPATLSDPEHPHRLPGRRDRMREEYFSTARELSQRVALVGVFDGPMALASLRGVPPACQPSATRPQASAPPRAAISKRRRSVSLSSVDWMIMSCSMRGTITAAEAECELLARYEVPRADLPGVAT